MRSVDEARAAIIDLAPGRTPVEQLPLAEAAGRVLARDVRARIDMPRWPNSAMDGYALRRADAERAGGQPLAVSQRIPAGVFPEPLVPGTAARIFTGAPVPEGADTVVMQEHCRADDGLVRVECLPSAGANIRPAAEDFAAGDVVLAAGCRLAAHHVGLAAAAGAAEVAVRRRPRVALLVTGDELAVPGTPLGHGQIYESNGHQLAAMVAAVGGSPLVPVGVPDDPAKTRAALAEAASADAVITSGGVSVGDADHVRGAIEALGSLDLFRVAVKPGKPLAFGRIGETPLLGLPGNPVSLLVTFALFGAPLLRGLLGREPVMPRPLPLPAGFEQSRTRGRDDYLRVRLVDGALVPHPRQGSGILSSAAWADGLACVPANRSVARGDPLDFHPMESLLG